jgi:hypothetical protein
MPADAAEIVRLAEAVSAATVSDNRLDVLCEVALFTPDQGVVAIRANAAGTKVIYTNRDGSEETYRAQDWTHGEPMRLTTARALRARAAQHDHEVG